MFGAWEGEVSRFPDIRVHQGRCVLQHTWRGPLTSIPSSSQYMPVPTPQSPPVWPLVSRLSQYNTPLPHQSLPASLNWTQYTQLSPSSSQCIPVLPHYSPWCSPIPPSLSLSSPVPPTASQCHSVSPQVPFKPCPSIPQCLPMHPCPSQCSSRVPLQHSQCLPVCSSNPQCLPMHPSHTQCPPSVPSSLPRVPQ